MSKIVVDGADNFAKRQANSSSVKLVRPSASLRVPLRHTWRAINQYGRGEPIRPEQKENFKSTRPEFLFLLFAAAVATDEKSPAQCDIRNDSVQQTEWKKKGRGIFHYSSRAIPARLQTFRNRKKKCFVCLRLPYGSDGWRKGRPPLMRSIRRGGNTIGRCGRGAKRRRREGTRWPRGRSTDSIRSRRSSTWKRSNATKLRHDPFLRQTKKTEDFQVATDSTNSARQMFFKSHRDEQILPRQFQRKLIIRPSRTPRPTPKIRR